MVKSKPEVELLALATAFLGIATVGLVGSVAALDTAGLQLTSNILAEILSVTILATVFSTVFWSIKPISNLLDQLEKTTSQKRLTDFSYAPPKSILTPPPSGES